MGLKTKTTHGQSTSNGESMFPEKLKKPLIKIWQEMSDEDKDHFINQVALFLTFYDKGKKEEEGKKLVVSALKELVESGCRNLADIGIFLAKRNKKDSAFEKAVGAIVRYRFRFALPSEPRTVLQI